MSILSKITEIKREFCPTLGEIDDIKIQRLVNQLKGDSEKETLINILEWEDKNIRYWTERWIVSWFLGIWIILFVVLVVEIVIGEFYRIPQFLTLIPALLFITLPFFVIIYLIISYRPLCRYEKSKLSKLAKLFGYFIDTIRPGLPSNKVLKYKLAICRDYARFTASLLLNIYPEIYFVTFFGHVAVGVKIGEKLYILDQRLPIFTLDTWLMKWNKKKITVHKLRKSVNADSTRLILEKCGAYKRTRRKSNNYRECIERLTFELVKVFKLSQKTEKKEPDLEIELKNYAIYCEDDEIVQYSMLRALRNKIEVELCSNINKLTKIELVQKDRDLVLKLYLS